MPPCPTPHREHYATGYGFGGSGRDVNYQVMFFLQPIGHPVCYLFQFATKHRYVPVGVEFIRAYDGPEELHELHQAAVVQFTLYNERIFQSPFHPVWFWGFGAYDGVGVLIRVHLVFGYCRVFIGWGF